MRFITLYPVQSPIMTPAPGEWLQRLESGETGPENTPHAGQAPVDRRLRPNMIESE